MYIFNIIMNIFNYKKKYKCRFCNAENTHITIKCPKLKCPFNCNKCMMLSTKGPHICRNCKGYNIHITENCPINKIMYIRKELILRRIKNQEPYICINCNAHNLHYEEDCPNNKCIFNCTKCSQKSIIGPHICKYCKGKNIHKSYKCSRKPICVFKSVICLFNFINNLFIKLFY
jgi:hypothetical protein